jgi:glutaredoxin 3
MSSYVLYVKNSCPYCHYAVDLLEEREMNYNLISVDVSQQLFESLKAAYSWATVPMIFRQSNDRTYELIGGFDDLKKGLEV